MPAGSESRTTTAGKWLFAGLVPFSALALGSLLPEILCFVTAVAALAGGLLWYDDSASIAPVNKWLLAAFVVLFGMTVLQAIPLPAGFVRVLAPENADIWAGALAPFREPGPSWHPISVSPSATRLEILRGTFYVCVLFAALRIAMLDKGERLLEQLVIGSTTAFALSSLAHAATGAEKIFGVYRPREMYAYIPGRLAPLLNLNHLAAYLVIGASVALGALIAKRSLPRPITAAALLVTAGTCVWAGSKGGMGSLVFGLLLTLAMSLYTKRGFKSGRTEIAVLAACGIAAAFMTAIAVSETARQELANRDFKKIEVVKNAFDLLPKSPWFGFGRGAFETVYPSVARGTGYMTFQNPENIVAQWTIEWGVPVALVGALLLAWALRPNTVLAAARPAVGPWVAIASVLLGDLVDFHLEVPGITALVVVCVALVLGKRVRRRVEDRERHGLRRPVLVGSLLAVVPIAVVATDLRHSLAEDRRRLAGMVRDNTIPRAAFDAEVRAAMLRAPSEPFFPLMGAVRAQQARDESVIPWIGRALDRYPRFGRAHFVLADSLFRTNPSQARLEYRLAYEYDAEELTPQIIQRGALLVVDEQSALELVPEGKLGVVMLEGLAKAVAPRLPSTAAKLDERLEQRSPGSPEVQKRRVAAALSDLENDHPWCEAREQCLGPALEAARTLTEREPTKCAPHLLTARIQIAAKRPEDALDAFERASETVEDRISCKRSLIELARSQGDRKRADRLFEGLMRGGCGSSAECTELYLWAAYAERARGNSAGAISFFRRAADASPERDDILVSVADQAISVGLYGEAMKAYETLSRRHPEDPRWQDKIQELRGKALGRVNTASPSQLKLIDAGWVPP